MDYPRICMVYPTYDAGLGLSWYAKFAMLIVFESSWAAIEADIPTMKALNADLKVLAPQECTYGYIDRDPLLTWDWINAAPETDEYTCLMRDTNGDVLLVPSWGHPMYNLTSAYCRQEIVDFSTSINAVWDGIFWDRMDGNISWLSADIDADLDGIADDPDTVDAAYFAGLVSLLTAIRVEKPNIIIVGNAADISLAPYVDGSMFELEMGFLLDRIAGYTWDNVIAEYLAWAPAEQENKYSILGCEPGVFFDSQYDHTDRHLASEAFVDAAEATEQRMRFGLASALLGSGVYVYDYGSEYHGDPWWYDEFDINLGESNGAAVAQGSGVWQRSFAGGSVRIDAIIQDGQIIATGESFTAITRWHGYLKIENLNLTVAQRNLLFAELQRRGPVSDRQPANLIHWRSGAADEAMIIEASYNDANLTIAGLKNLLSALLEVDVATISDATTNPAYGPLVTFTQGGTDYLEFLRFGGASATWADSGIQARAYIEDEGW